MDRFKVLASILIVVCALGCSEESSSTEMASASMNAGAVAAPVSEGMHSDPGGRAPMPAPSSGGRATPPSSVGQTATAMMPTQVGGSAMNGGTVPPNADTTPGGTESPMSAGRPEQGGQLSVGGSAAPAGGADVPMGGQPIPAQPTATFSNAPTPCRMGSVVGPNIPQEVGHWAASTLTPPSYPFSVTEVQYDLMNRGSDRCTNTLAHTTQVFVINGMGAPVALPATDGGQFLSMPIRANENAEAKRSVRLVLERPIELQDGQRLVVSIQLTATDNQRLCMGMCDDEESPIGQEWWSNSAESPFNWQDMNADFRIRGEFVISASGNPL